MPQVYEKFFANVERFIAQLELGPEQSAARELRQGLGSLNGLTDGWWLFLESVIKVEKTEAYRHWNDEWKEELRLIHAFCYRHVFRKKYQWWKFWKKHPY